MPENPATVDQLVEAGIFAYKHEDYRAAMEYLLEASDQELRNWRAVA